MRRPTVRRPTVRRIVLFGDTVGIPQILDVSDVLGPARIIAFVAAGIRLAQHESIAGLARAAGVPFLVQPRPADPTYSDFVARLRALNPDLLLINSYSMLLRPDVLSLPSAGCVNVHGALLPAYRGATVTEWAVINEEAETGVTMHMIDDGIDTGPILAQRRVPLGFDDTWVDVRRRVQAATVGLLRDTLPEVLAGRLAAVPQDESHARHHRRRTRDDGAFAWSQSVRSIYNLVRALVPPHPGAHYQEPAGTLRIIDRYLTVPEVLGLKFSAGGGGFRLEGDAVRLEPLPPDTDDRARANRTIALEVHGRAGGPRLGTCVLERIDYASGRWRLRLGVDRPGDWVNEAVAMARRLAVAELGLAPVEED
ncbi:methionyl-tRNA formyltransferase [Azospirillum sp. sgz302134]